MWRSDGVFVEVDEAESHLLLQQRSLSVRLTL